jgi:nucleotide-binding universal stress UspA family protein
MKLLIAYDGSDCSRAAVDDLIYAGLPSGTQALVLTAAETWLPKDADDGAHVETFGFTGAETIKQMREAAAEKLAESEGLARDAAAQIQERFPEWQVSNKSVGGFPEREILSAAKEWQPDLIVTGSHGRSILGRLVLGSVSLKILSEAKCSVRIGRRSPSRAQNDNSPLRIVVAVDGSADSQKTIETVIRRSWLPETSIRLLTVIENLPYSVLQAELPRADNQRKSAAETLEKAGLHVSAQARAGRAKDLLIEEAENWGADAIFMGAKGHGLLERFWLGSVSYSVAAGANCSVEIIRGE